MNKLKTFFFIALYLFLANAKTQSASIIPVCYHANFFYNLNTCLKDFLSFPLFTSNEAGETAFVYKLDQESLGEFSNNEVRAIVNESLAQWQNESSLKFFGSSLDTDITTTNLNTYLDEIQGFNLIILDEDGSIIDELYGTNAKQYTLGYATPIAYNLTNGQISSTKEAQSLLNGFLFNRANVQETKAELTKILTTTILHEFAHMFGIDHTQGGNLEDFLNDAGDWLDIPVMFPIAANPEAELHQDDIAAVKLAYPKASEINNFAQISGSIKNRKKTQVTNANIVAYKVDEVNPKLYAVASPSDVDGQGHGNYVIPNLLPGDYILFAEPINSSFQGGSSIGMEHRYSYFQPRFFDPESGNKFLNYEEAISTLTPFTLSAGEVKNINIDIAANCFQTNNDINASFLVSGRLVNCKSINLKRNKVKYSKIKIININKETPLNIRLSTDYPELIKFKWGNTHSIKKGRRKIQVKLARRRKFIQHPDFANLRNKADVSFSIYLEDLDTGFIQEETIIVN